MLLGWGSITGLEPIKERVSRGLVSKERVVLCQRGSITRTFWFHHQITKGYRWYILGPVPWRWETLGRWGNPPSRGPKIKRVYMQSYNPGVLRWGFLRLLLRLQLRSLSRGIPSSHLEKDERLILKHIWIYSWRRHA